MFLCPVLSLFNHNIFWKHNVHLLECSAWSAALRYSISEKWRVYLLSFCMWRSVYFLDLLSVSGGVCMYKLLCSGCPWQVQLRHINSSCSVWLVGNEKMKGLFAWNAGVQVVCSSEVKTHVKHLSLMFSYLPLVFSFSSHSFHWSNTLK